MMMVDDVDALVRAFYDLHCILPQELVPMGDLLVRGSSDLRAHGLIAQGNLRRMQIGDLLKLTNTLLQTA